ncbi:MAG: hypothetical protein K6A89_07060 [Treponema sp.]|nr:hypothetical protein [Treponema sp.]
MANMGALLRDRYSIPKVDLADSGETNRLHILFISPFLFAFGFGDLIVITIKQIISGGVRPVSFFYFAFFTIISIYLFVYSRLIKDAPREKAYILKTIPFYMLFWTSMIASIYNFYILGQPFNGVLIFCISGFLALNVFSFSPVPFSLALLTGLCFLSPGVYKHFGLTGLLDTCLAMILDVSCSLYKRRVEKKYLILLKKQKKSLEVKTFGNFTILYDNKVIKFSRSKSPELLAYLIYKKGSSVKTKELLSVLYGDHADSEKYGASLRNLIVDVKKSLEDLEVQNFFIKEYNNFRINPEAIKCDYYDFLAGDSAAIKSFSGEFMSQFSWAEETAAFLEQKVLK